MANTSIVNRIAIHATASTALPTLPAATGSNVSQSDWSTAGFETISSRELKSDNYDIDEETFSFSVEERFHETRAPLSHGSDEVLLLGNKLNPIEVTLYDIDGALLTLASDMSFSTSRATWANSYTARTVAIEINGLGIFEFPSAIVTFTNIEMGPVENQVARCLMMIKPQNVSGSDYPGGWRYEEY